MDQFGFQKDRSWKVTFRKAEEKFIKFLALYAIRSLDAIG